jgi:hypothetical protein
MKLLKINDVKINVASRYIEIHVGFDDFLKYSLESERYYNFGYQWIFSTD